LDPQSTAPWEQNGGPNGTEALGFLQAPARAIGSLGSWFVEWTVSANDWLQRTVWRRLGLVAIMVAAAAGVSYLLWPKVEYLPTGNRNLVITIVLPPPGYNLDELTRLGETLAADLRPYWDVDPRSPEARDPEHPAIGDFFFVARGRQVFLGLRAEDPSRVADLVPLIRGVGAKIPGTFVVAKQTSLFEQGLTAGRTIDIEITGPELKELVQLGGAILGQVSGGQAGPGVVPGAQARPVPSLDLSSPEVHVEPKLLQAADLGLSTADIGYAVDALVDGAYASDYYIGGTKIDLAIKSRAATVERTQDLEALPIATPTGHLVPLGAVANVKLASGPEQVNHRERQRAITIEVTPPPETALEDAMAAIEGQIVRPMREGGRLPPGYVITLSGTSDKLRSTWRALRFNVILALAITYLLMAALYESWLYPFVIIFSVPLGAVGGVMGLALLNVFVLQPLDVLTMLGFVILIGTVVNNAILIVHQSLIHLREGKPPAEAIPEAVRVRIRPIFMTTMTTLFGLLPLVLFPGAGSELYRGLGAVLLGGLLVSTVFTLFLIPTFFRLALETKARLATVFRRGEAQA
jgi:HAE1 family hydrophobic/amphiphilic exporter-1